MSKICGTCGLPVAGDEPSDGRDHLTNDGCLDALLRAVARLREENTGLRALAEAQRGHIEIINAAFERVARESERLRGLLAEAHPALHEACQGSMCCPDGCLADKVRSALTPKGGDRE